MRKIFFLLCSLFISVHAFSASNNNLFNLMNQRLSFMPDVAANKYLTHQPVEVLEQEQKVLERTLNIADQEGLDADSVKPFVIAQMNVAKAIQYRYIADWLSQPNIQLNPQSLDAVRVHISNLTVEMMKQIAVSLKTKDKSICNSRRFMHDVKFNHLTKSDQQYLFTTLQNIKLK
ncbi:chorismate mutase [Acinetobacter pollinis]|uniref:chorismate mutase n=1 Tax=Acinetobacter pollinis TaxID=2605270 RepID=A0ABU6DT07_9GAMM|nr:chorismate mutase [Acinetobacter pollinis]MEB5476269.1 chorismate mutase [Acinetobacter pollinis]